MQISFVLVSEQSKTKPVVETWESFFCEKNLIPDFFAKTGFYVAQHNREVSAWNCVIVMKCFEVVLLRVWRWRVERIWRVLGNLLKVSG